MMSIHDDAKKIQETLDSFLYYDKKALLNAAAENVGMERKCKEMLEIISVDTGLSIEELMELKETNNEF